GELCRGPLHPPHVPYTTLFRSAEATLEDARRELAMYRERFAEPELLLAEATVRRVRGEDAEAVGAVLRAAVELATRQGSHAVARDRKSTRLNSSHSQISYAVFC